MYFSNAYSTNEKAKGGQTSEGNGVGKRQERHDVYYKQVFSLIVRIAKTK